MKRRIAFISSVLVLLFTCLTAYSQNCQVLNQYRDRAYTKEEINALEKRVCELLKKRKAIPEDRQINIYYIPDYYLPPFGVVPPDSIREYFATATSLMRIKKSDFINGKILRRLSRQQEIRINKKHDTTYIPADVIVTNSLDSVIAHGDARYLYYCLYEESRFILENMYKLNLKYMFTLHHLWLDPVFGVTEKDEIVVFLFDLAGKSYKVYSIKEFVDLYSKSEIYNFFRD